MNASKRSDGMADGLLDQSDLDLYYARVDLSQYLEFSNYLVFSELQIRGVL